MDRCCECGGEAQGGEVIASETAEGIQLAYRCWTCFLGPPPRPCCARAHEQGYRRGYRHGYWYALWDLGEALRIPDGLWQTIERFYYEDLRHWVGRALRAPNGPLPREGGPRLRLARRARTGGQDGCTSGH
jgi:hypothetical protein